MKFTNTLAALALGILFSASALAGDYEGGSSTNAHAKAKSASYSEQGNAQSINTNNYGSDLGDSVPAVIAPALTTTLSETCMGSTSFGASGAGFGLTIGSTWRDAACVRRLDARELRSFGVGLTPNDAILFHFAAKERMCEDDKIRAAFERVSKMTGRKDALCQSTADEQKVAAANRAADGITGTTAYVEQQVGDVAIRKEDEKSLSDMDDRS